jgi:hypothetical protein
VATFAEGIEVGAKYVAQSLNVGSQYIKRSFELYVIRSLIMASALWPSEVLVI